MLKLGMRGTLALLAAGGLLVAVGTAMVYLPAGIVIGGAEVIACALWLVDVQPRADAQPGKR